MVFQCNFRSVTTVDFTLGIYAFVLPFCLNDWLRSRAEDPIFEYLESSYDTKYFSIVLSDKSLLYISVHTLNADNIDFIEDQKNIALEQIRSWGFNPYDYEIIYITDNYVLE